MENMTELKEKNMKLGGGIITVSIIYLLSSVFGLFRSISNFSKLDEINAAAAQFGVPQTTKSMMILSIVLSIAIIISVSLILFKKAIGVYGFVGVTILNVISSVITNGVNILTIIVVLIGLILPVLLIYFIYKKKHIYFGER